MIAIYIVTFFTSFPIACPDGRIGCLVDHRDNRMDTKAFIDRKEAIIFMEDKNQLIFHRNNCTIDSVTSDKQLIQYLDKNGSLCF